MDFLAVDGRYRNKETNEIVVLKDPQFHVSSGDGDWRDDYILYKEENRRSFKAMTWRLFVKKFEYIEDS